MTFKTYPELSFRLDFRPFFSSIFNIDNDGSDELILSTIRDYNQLTIRSRIYVLGIEDGKIVDKTQRLFSEIPEFFWVRDIHIGDINGDGINDIFFSNQGR